jgi:hypothetical protein
VRADLRPTLSPDGKKAVTTFAKLVHATTTRKFALQAQSGRRLRSFGWVARRRTPRMAGGAVEVFAELVHADESRSLPAIKNCLARLKMLGWTIFRIQPHAGRRGHRAY